MAYDSNAPGAYKLYRYTPSTVAAVIFVILFTITTGLHSHQLARSKSWYFTPFVIGGFFEIIGYVGRILAHSNINSVPIYSLQTILILLAPALFAASIYIVLGRLMVFLRAERLSIVPVKWMTKIFVCGDVIAFLSQAAGGGIMASGTASALKTGEHITIAGLCVQLVFFSFFIFTAARFHVRFLRSSPSTPTKLSTKPRFMQRNWESVLLALYTASFLVLIRSAFRVIEYAMGNDGYLMGHEAFSYVFDATLMFLAMVSLYIVHPSDVIKRKENTGLITDVLLN